MIWLSLNGVPRVDDQRVLNGIFRVLRSGSPWLYKKRNLIEWFFNKLKCYRRIATCYDKLGSSFLAMAKLACIRLRLRHNESTA